MGFQDHFSTKAGIYARARPTYPPSLFAALAALAPGRGCVWDCGTGNGQAAVALAGHFDRVFATEPSAAQLAEAPAHPRITYVQSAETAPGLGDGAADLVTAAQAAHWFDRDKFYAEVRRVARPGALVALWAYELCRIEPEIDAIVGRFYAGPIGPYWPAERRHVMSGYRDFEFPFTEVAFPPAAMEHDWTLAEFMAYLRTWSAVTRYTKAHGQDPLGPLETELARGWGAQARRIVWPLAGRIGRVG